MILTGALMLIICAIGLAVLMGLVPGVKSPPLSEAHGFALLALFAIGAIVGLVVLIVGIINH